MSNESMQNKSVMHWWLTISV